MKPRDVLEIIGNGAMYVLSVTQTKEIFEIISLCLSILISIIIIGGKLYRWWKNAKADGKITKDEIDEAIQIIEDGTKQINDIKEKGENKK